MYSTDDYQNQGALHLQAATFQDPNEKDLYQIPLLNTSNPLEIEEEHIINLYEPEGQSLFENHK